MAPEALSIVCPACDAENRVPSHRLPQASKATCGRCKAALFSGQPIALDEPERFQKHVTRSGVPVLVDFWAPWCGPCRTMAPEFEKAARQLEPRVRLAKVDTERAQSVAARYGIQAIPTMILFRNGQEGARQSGAMQAGGIVRFVDAHSGPDL